MTHFLKMLAAFFLLLLMSLSCKESPKKAELLVVQNNDSTVQKVINIDSVAVIKPDLDISPNLKVSDSTIYLYLTFDDGPNNGTPHLLSILKEFKISASLFIVGKHVYSSKFQQKLFNDYGNYELLETCNHSFTHANHKYKQFYSNPDGVLEDFRCSHDSLRFSNRICRAPGYNMWSIEGDSSRFRTKIPAAEKLKENGFKMVGWDLDWDFKHITDHQHFIRRLIELENTNWPQGKPSYVKGHLVVLMHDQSFTDPNKCEEFRKFLNLVKRMPQKYQFRKISEYPLLKRPSIALQ